MEKRIGGEREGKRAMIWINVVGGFAVLGSYAYCLTSDPSRVGDFWGGVPDGLRRFYTVNMFLAAAGYFAFSFFILARLKPAAPGSRHFGRATFNALYGLVLVPSALWMPLTFSMLESPSDILGFAIRLTLVLVGTGSLGILVGLVRARWLQVSRPHAGDRWKPLLLSADRGSRCGRMARLLPCRDPHLVFGPPVEFF